MPNVGKLVFGNDMCTSFTMQSVFTNKQLLISSNQNDKIIIII